MKRNCPHCGQEQLIADEEVIAPWVFTRCSNCQKLSILKKEGAVRRPSQKHSSKAAPKPKVSAPQFPARVEIQERERTRDMIRPTGGTSNAQRAPSLPTETIRSQPVRAEAVLGAFTSSLPERATSAREESPPGRIAALLAAQDESREWRLPPYFSPHAAESEQVLTLRVPPQAPEFLRKKRQEAQAPAVRKDPDPEPVLPPIPELPDPVFEPLAAAVREELELRLDPNGEFIRKESDDEGDSGRSPPSSGSGRRPPGPKPNLLLGMGALLIGIGFGGYFGLNVLHKSAFPEKDPVFTDDPSTKPARPHAAAAPPPSEVQAPVLKEPPRPVVREPAAPNTPGPGDTFSAPPAGSPLWVVRIAGAKAVLRAGPGKQFRILGPIEPGSRWVVRKWNTEWFQVEPENLGPGTLGIGWVRNDLVKPLNNGGSE